MCGHVGVAGDLTAAAARAFKDMLYMDALRGRHGTGIFTVPFRGDRMLNGGNIVKAPFSAEVCLQNKAFEKAAEDPTSAVIMGHNRHATIGQHIQGNTHPFRQGDIVGAHNGTVSAGNRTLKVKGSFGTDSEKIMASISQYGIQDTIKEMIPCSQGAWAFVWYDFHSNEINFLRNEYRPFFYGFSKDRGIMYWASEAHILRAACARRGADLDKVYELPVDTHLRWTVPGVGEVFGKETRSKCVGKKRPALPAYKGNTSRVRNTGTRNGTTTGFGVRIPSDFSVELQDYTLFDNSDVVELFQTKKQCIWCHEEVTAADIKNKGGAAVVARNSVVCAKHAKLPIFQATLKARISNEIASSKSKSKTAKSCSAAN